MRLKYRRWHKWIDSVTIIGEEYSSRELIGRLIDFCKENNNSLSNIPPSQAVSNYLHFSGKFEKSDSYEKTSTIVGMGKRYAWVRIK
jgi:hypothetical protein